MIPGGGPEKSDCYVVPGVEGTRGPTTARTLDCVDGELSCDLDGQCDDQCQFGLRVCVNQPGLSGCTPPSALDGLRLRDSPPNVTLSPPAGLQGAVCTDKVNAAVAVKARPNGLGGPAPSLLYQTLSSPADRPVAFSFMGDDVNARGVPSVVA